MMIHSDDDSVDATAAKPGNSSGKVFKQDAPTHSNTPSTLQRKRKSCDDDEITSLFKSFASEITGKLNNWKTDLDANISQINHNINTVIKSDLESLNKSVGVIKSEVASIRAEYSDLRHQVNDLQIKQATVNEDVDALKTSINHQACESRDTTSLIKNISLKINPIGEDVNGLKNQIRVLESELNSMQQLNRANNIEITGLPEIKNEDLKTVLLNIAKYIQVDLQSDEIEYITRIAPKQKIPGRPKAVVARLRSSLLRDAIISGVRKTRGITSQDIGIRGDSKNLYINEHLTPVNKMLHKKTKEAAKIKMYQFVWIRNGKIFMRKHDGAPLIRIETESDLKKAV